MLVFNSHFSAICAATATRRSSSNPKRTKKVVSCADWAEPFPSVAPCWVPTLAIGLNRGRTSFPSGFKGCRRNGTCLLYTSDAADDLLCVDLGGRRIIKKKK